tara:strand:+ start:181 stop:396 length:216 start_codon:yes stop_codon:yes gene_type:complete
MTIRIVTGFFDKNPTLLMQIGDWKLWEHPILGDNAPIYMTTPSGNLINTGYYDLGDFDLQLCIELSGDFTI